MMKLKKIGWIFLWVACVTFFGLAARRVNATDNEFADLFRGMDAPTVSPIEEPSNSLVLSRFQILLGGYAAVELGKVIELKAEPYIELRFERR